MHLLMLTMILSLSVNGQDMKKTIETGDSFFERKQYQQAGYYYQRAVFFDDSLKYQNLYVKLANCHIQLNNYHRAFEILSIAQHTCPNDTLYDFFQLNKVMVLLKEGKFELALSALLRSNNNIEQFRHERLFLFGITWFLLDDIKKAKYYFNLLIKQYPEKKHLKQEMEQIYSRTEKYQQINPEKASWYSTFVPGLGQFYAQDVKNGLNSMFLNYGLFSLTVFVGVKVGYLNSFLTFFPWMFRYYSSGIKNANLIAKKRKLELKKKEYQNIFHIFEISINKNKSIH